MGSRFTPDATIVLTEDDINEMHKIMEQDAYLDYLYERDQAEQEEQEADEYGIGQSDLDLAYQRRHLEAEEEAGHRMYYRVDCPYEIAYNSDMHGCYD